MRKKNAVLYIHGKGGSAEESGHYKPLFPGCEVLGLDYQSFIANSIGAFFSMHAGIGAMVQKAYFISPIVDMERLILDMVTWAGVTEAQLEEKGVISTPFGEDLSWEYLSYVREYPVQWNVPTRILYGSHDSMTAYETIAAFANAHGAELTVMENGEHWFHTEEQMRFLDQWIRQEFKPDRAK